MSSIAIGLAERGISSLRYQFPFMARGSKRPDPPATAHGAVRAAVEEAGRIAPGMPLFAGGRSYGGRMTSQAQAILPLPDVRGLIFFAFPLHPAEKPSSDRAAHLAAVAIPMLFLQGTRDSLAEPGLLRATLSLTPCADLVLARDADHAFHVQARSGRRDPDVMDEILDATASWIDGQG